VKARRRAEILACAARVFAERGFPGTDMQAVADAAGVAKGTLYLYFTSKEELFLAAADQGMRQMREAVDAEADQVSDPLKRMRVAVRAFLQFFRDHPEQVELMLQERAEFRSRTTPTYFLHRAARAGQWHDRLRGLIANGRLRDISISRIDDALCDMVYGAMLTTHMSGRQVPVDEQADGIIDVAFHGILSEAERKKEGGEQQR
jgi:AcrR family transcriptional regulator